MNSIRLAARLVVLALVLPTGCANLPANPWSPPDEDPDPKPTENTAAVIDASAHAERARTTQEGEIHTTKLKDFAIDKQQEDDWCWAACAEMILRFNGEATTQEEIARRIHGTNPDDSKRVLGASYYEIMCALNPEIEASPFDAVWTGLGAQFRENPALMLGSEFGVDEGGIMKLGIDSLPKKTVAVSDLLAGHPAVVGLSDPLAPDLGHAFVFIGAKYTIHEGAEALEEAKPFGDVVKGWIGIDGGASELVLAEVYDRMDGERYQPSVVMLVDPWYKTVVEMDMEEFEQRVDFVLSRTKARETLIDMQGIAKLEVK